MHLQPTSRTALMINYVWQRTHSRAKFVPTNVPVQPLAQTRYKWLREIQTYAKKEETNEVNRPLQEGTVAPMSNDRTISCRLDTLLDLIEQSRVEQNSERELELLLDLYGILKRRNEQDADAFEAVFCIARLYDAQFGNTKTAIKYYEEAVEVLKKISTEETVWGAYMRLTTIGALAVCYENLDNADIALKYFEDAIEVYEKHCDKASDREDNASTSDIYLLIDLNATVAMVHYHYAGNLLARGCWEEVKIITKTALTLAENSSMPIEDLETLQQCIHDLWLDMSSSDCN
ncbi:putative tetratricopeptide-like helical domain superfamily [Plasmopara halstedii]